MTSDRWPRVVGGHPALDFVNTDVFFRGHAGEDILRSTEELLAWLAHIGITRDAQSSPRADPALLRDAATLRTALRSVTEAIAHTAPVEPDALAALRSAYAAAVGRATPELDRHGFRWARHDTTPRALLDELTRDGVDLLRHGTIARIKACPSCGFVFLDTTKNASRRWCTMDDCGKREKMRRYVTKRAASKPDERVAD